MSTALIIFVTLCYVGVAGNKALRGNYPMAVVFAGYSIANLGFIMGGFMKRNPHPWEAD